MNSTRKAALLWITAFRGRTHSGSFGRRAELTVLSWERLDQSHSLSLTPLATASRSDSEMSDAIRPIQPANGDNACVFSLLGTSSASWIWWAACTAQGCGDRA